MTPEQAAKLREKFPDEMIGKLPKAGIFLDYVGHAAVTDRLLQVDPDWTWEYLPDYPVWDGGMWIMLTVGGVSRPGFGDGKNPKEWISDAIRNAAMRFGVALDLWSKQDLHDQQQAAKIPEPEIFVPGQAAMDAAQDRCKALAAAGIDILKARTEAKLPPLARVSEPEQWLAWQILLDDLGVLADEKANA